MSLTKDGGTFIAECDFCSHGIDTEEPDFLDAVDFIKKQGWKVFKKNGEWNHECGSCQLEFDFDVVS